jgi:amino acid transporter
MDMSLRDLILGRPLANYEESEQRLGSVAGIGVFGLDALNSAAYGPEAALTILAPLGALSLYFVVPISFSIIGLLIVVYISYRQTIAAYPKGGGSYTVARQNLGQRFGLLAPAGLIVDYVLTVAVGISAGVAALVSAMPQWQPHTLELCLGILALITLINLRGVHETGNFFMVPTYLYVACLLGALGLVAAKTFASGGSPSPVIAPHPISGSVTMAGAWIILQSFASGCTAMTGVEAVSNGVKAFREPAVRSARRTLSIIIGILVLMLAGIAWLTRVYRIGATDPAARGYESLLSQLIAAAAGKGAFYYLSIGSILAVLALSAKTAFAGFPRLCQVVAEDGYLPHGFRTRGRRLVFSEGVYVLAALAALLLIVFGGITDRLIPLYAVGALLAFTLSQAGMVAHWKRTGGATAWSGMLINGVRRSGYGRDSSDCPRRQVRDRRLDHRAVDPVVAGVHDRGPPPLPGCCPRDRTARSLEPEPPHSADRSNTHAGLVQISAKALRFAMIISTEVHVLQVNDGDRAPDLRSGWSGTGGITSCITSELPC